MPEMDSPSETVLRQRLGAHLRASPTLMHVLQVVRSLALPDWRVASGAVYQTVWNALTGREPDYGIKDYDVMYFDPETSWDAEDAVIRRVARAFDPALAAKVEVRNQARVHLWFEGKFGESYAPLAGTDESLTRFVSPAFAVGVRLEADGGLDVVAPFGLTDCFAMRLRPNPARGKPSAALYARVSEGARARWPEVGIEPLEP